MRRKKPSHIFLKGGIIMKNRNPIFSAVVNFAYSKGEYKFFTKTCAALMTIVFGTLQKAEQTATDFFRLVSCIWIVNHTTHKLQGISSISSSVCDNVFCAARRAIKNCICAHCYAHNQQTIQTGLKEHNIINGLILRNILIPGKFFKGLAILFPYLRIESFGDTANVTQARNYIRIIKAFPEKRCAIWSKNIAIWGKAFALEGKPKNTTYVHSSSFVNVEEKPDLEKYPFIDHVFTVFDKKYIRENNIEINCGGKKCMECILAKKNCYYRTNKTNNTYFIREALK